MSERPVAMVIGGAGYVGEAIVRTYEEAGWRAVPASRSGNGGIVCDVTDRDSVMRAIETIRAEHGRIDVLIHAASPRLERVRPDAVSPEMTDEHAETAVTGTRIVIEQAERHSIPVVIVVTSQAAFGDPNRLTMGSYPDAKRAQEMVVAEHARSAPSPLIFTVAPGFLPGGLNADLPAAIQTAFSKRPDGRTNTREELARTILSIAVDRERYPTSCRVDPVDGTRSPF